MAEYRAHVGLDVHKDTIAELRSHGRAGRSPSTGVSSGTGAVHCRNSSTTFTDRRERY